MIPPYQHLFLPETLKTSHTRVDSDCIEIIEINNRSIKAAILERKRYNQEILWNGNQYTQLKCTCPFAWDGPCYHLAAILDYVADPDNQQQVEHARSIDIYGSKELIEFMTKADKSDLTAFIEMLIAENPSLSERLVLFLSGPNKMKIKLRSLIDSYIKQYSDHHGLLHWNTTQQVAKYFDSIMHTMYRARKYDDLVQFCPHLIARLNYQLLYVDDSNAELSSTVEGAIDYLSLLLRSERLSLDLNIELFNRIMALLDDRDTYAFDFGHDLWSLISQVVISDEQYKIFSEKMVSHIEGLDDGWIRHYNLEKMLVCQIQCLASLGDHQQMEHMIDQNLHLNRIRKIAVEMRLQQYDYEGALKLVDAGLEMAMKHDEPASVKEWEKAKLQIFEARGDQTAHLEQAIHNLINHDFNRQNFQLVKTMTTDEEWPMIRDSLIDQIRQKGALRSEYHLMEIYHLEGMWQALFDAVSNYGIDFYILDQYVDDLIKFDKKVVIDMYLARIEKFINPNVGRKYYKVVARYLKKIKAWGAPEKASDLAEKLRMSYPHRPALLEELEGI